MGQPADPVKTLSPHSVEEVDAMGQALPDAKKKLQIMSLRNAQASCLSGCN